MQKYQLLWLCSFTLLYVPHSPSTVLVTMIIARDKAAMNWTARALNVVFISDAFYMQHLAHQQHYHNSCSPLADCHYLEQRLVKVRDPGIVGLIQRMAYFSSSLWTALGK